MLAAEDVGEDGRGKDGLRGYLRRVAKKDSKSFSNLIGKIIPHQVTGPDDGPIQIEDVGIREAFLSRIASLAERVRSGQGIGGGDGRVIEGSAIRLEVLGPPGAAGARGAGERQEDDVADPGRARLGEDANGSGVDQE